MTETDHAAPAGERPTWPRTADLRAVFFDFDGVVLDSANIKDRAFRDLFAHLPELQEQILEHHREHLGRSRFEKFDWIYRVLLGRELEPDESAALGDRFSELCEEEMLSCPFVPGACDLLEALQGRIDCWLVSATPQEDLDRLVDRRRLRGYFREICGWPPAKTAVFAGLMSRHDLAPDEVLSIGDGLSDYRAARATGVHFVARACDSSRQDWSSMPVATVRDLTEILDRLGLAGTREASRDD